VAKSVVVPNRRKERKKERTSENTINVLFSHQNPRRVCKRVLTMSCKTNITISLQREMIISRDHPRQAALYATSHKKTRDGVEAPRKVFGGKRVDRCIVEKGESFFKVARRRFNRGFEVRWHDYFKLPPFRHSVYPLLNLSHVS